jgi:hypothetical protein
MGSSPSKPTKENDPKLRDTFKNTNAKQSK